MYQVLTPLDCLIFHTTHAFEHAHENMKLLLFPRTYSPAIVRSVCCWLVCTSWLSCNRVRTTGGCSDMSHRVRVPSLRARKLNRGSSSVVSTGTVVSMAISATTDRRQGSDKRGPSEPSGAAAPMNRALFVVNEMPSR